MFEEDRFEDWRGIDVADPDGVLLGEVVEVLLDTDTDAPEWIVVGEPVVSDVDRSRRSAPMGVRLIPMTGVSFAQDALISRWPAEQVAGAVVDGATEGISRRDEDRLYRHYGLDYPTHWVNDGMPGGAETVGVAGIAAEARHSSDASSRSRVGSSADHEVDEPRRVEPARSASGPSDDEAARREDERRAIVDGIGDGAG